MAVTQNFAGAILQAFDSFGRTDIRVTLPSGKVIRNAAGWGDTQWDQQIQDASPADLETLTSLKASWDVISSDLKQQVLAENSQPSIPATAAQTAQDDAPQGPNAPQANTNPATPDATTAANTDTNTDPEVRTTEQTQSTPPAGEGAPLKENDAPANAPTQSGTTTNDDTASTQRAQIAKDLNQNFNAAETITPQPNILDNYSSYTYTASVYLMTPAQYQKLLATKKKTVNGYNLLFQTGGAPNNVGGAKGPGAVSSSTELFDTEAQAAAAQSASSSDAGRNPAFDNDFYIDSITINNALPGKNTGAAHMVTDIKFTVIEPNGITLLDKLYKAVQDFVPKDGAGNINYTAVSYLLVIRWYGYDQAGKLQRVGGISPDGTSDPNALTEKFIPFIIKKINWGVSNKLVSYEFDCAAIGQQIAGTTRRGTIPYDVELSASTVGKLLGDNVAFSAAASTNATTKSPGPSTTDSSGRRAAASDPRVLNNQQTTAPPKADAAPSDKKTITQGLMGAMNEFQQSLVDRKIYQRADSYKIVWANGAEKIRDAKIVLPGKTTTKKSTPMEKPATEDASNLLSEKSAMDVSVRNFSITAGQQILQAIDLAIRNSSYISDQALTIDNEDGTTEVRDQAKNNPVKWYQISMSAAQTKYDTLRNDYAYDITFTISPYEIPNFDSKYFPVSRFKGVHKTYPYWFTGMNTSVLDFQQTFNSLYNITVTGNSPETSSAAQLRKKYTSSMREIPYYTYQPRSTESSSGAELKGNEIAANAAEYLYSPSDMARSKVRIVGDPAWIQQGSIFAGVSPTAFNYSAFNPDGTINFDSQQVMFEVSWQRPEDYDLGTGLADPYAKSGSNRQPAQSTVYQATKVTSEFRNGRFEQVLEGSIYMFPIPSGKNKAPGGNANAANGVDANGNSVGIDVRDESGQLSNLRRNPETGELYNPGTLSRSGNSSLAESAASSATQNNNAVKTAPPAPAEAASVASPPSEEETTNLTQSSPAQAATSNGEDVESTEFNAPPKLGETDTPQVGSVDLGDFYG